MTEDKINVEMLNNALGMLQAIPAFAEPLRKPGAGKIEGGPLERQIYDFLETVCRNGCGHSALTSAGRKIFAFRDCIVTVERNGTTTLVRDPARTNIVGKMTIPEIEELLAA